MRVCVTGGAGFIGSHLVDRLIALGHTVLVIDNLTTGVREFVNPKAVFIEMDVRDANIESIFADFKPQVVFHEAAQTMVPASMENPKMDCDVNLLGLVNILEASRKHKVEHFLMPSSAAVYGDLDTLPLTEDMIGKPTSFYGLTKLTGEGYLRIYEQAFGLKTVCFRYSNVYGPRQGDGGEGGVISIFTRLINEGQGLTIFGDGEQTRDFIYVDDVVEANIKAMNHPELTGVYNISTNTSTSVNKLVSYFKSISNKDLLVYYEAERTGDIRHSRLCNQKAKVDFDFLATVDLERGLRDTISYFKGK
ncbi:NAD-dependent epimerase/dehydratase family protein [Veillonella tobetsuensis]|jgi:rmlD substrate binding domain protein|uniref:UDP-glucose 4-epimerase n=1 Tax=Veillonella tobetsuensis TaxID=1110546 RepID=A0A2S7ZMW2_9FIRM|nr:NAD-dependent epimerase/dehydratase family protein [Veillonella tobetsuensis]PQL24571.1 UDP-glucose 4-epimerase [Veillonella tobetsuensis]GCL66985.1 UDP-glucose 4-epimerase [Veillonella tobetsuensis]